MTTSSSSPRSPELFVDGQSALVLAGGAVRLDLHALETSKRSLRGDQEPVVQVRLVLSPGAFLQVMDSLGDFVAANGIEPAPADDPGPGAAEKRSPNFRPG
jgi:hypothetical protein